MLLFGAAAGSNVTATPAAPAVPQAKKKVVVEAPLAPVAVSSTPTYRRYVHPHAKAMAGIDWARITTSPLGKKLSAQIDAMGLMKKAAIEGMDFVADIDKLMLSTPGEAGANAGQVKLSEEAPFVVAMQGRFKIEALRRSLIGRKASRLVYQGSEVWMPAKGDTALAIVNSRIMLVGDRKSLKATLDAQAAEAGGEESAVNSVLTRAAELAGQYDLWLVSDASLEGVGNSASAAGASAPQAEMMKSIDQFELGVSFRQGLKADVSLHGRSPEDISKLGTMLAGIKMLAAMSIQEKKDPELNAMLEKLKIGTAQDRVVISLQYSQKELDRGIASLMSGPNAGGKNADTIAAATPATAPVVVQPPAPLIVHIYNADGGRREFTLTR